MIEPIEETYFGWLYSKLLYTHLPSTPTLSFHTLLRALHNTEFLVMNGVPMDENRWEDGMDLRREFPIETGIYPPSEWMNMPPSLLEVIFALARRLEWDTDLEAADWFWRLIGNLGLSEMNDGQVDSPEPFQDVLFRLIWRTYKPDGSNGGLFPLRNPPEDQREVEIWTQAHSYLHEHQDEFEL